MNALTERICGGKTEVVARGPDAQVLSRYEDIWKWRERKQRLVSILTITLIPGVLLAIISFTTFWFFKKAGSVKLGTARLLSAVEPLLVQVILLLFLFPACFEFIVDRDDRSFAILLVFVLVSLSFAEFRSLRGIVRKRKTILRSSSTA